MRSSCASPPDPFPDLRLVFAGTPEYAEQALSRLLDAGHEVALVLTQPDRPAGRGMRPSPSAVKRLALSRGLPVFQPATLKSPEAVARIQAAQADALVVAAYGLILPPAALNAARLGALNIHASLLPRWRGAAPIQRALLAGDRESGVSIMLMDQGLDTGPVLAQRPVPIAEDEDAGSLHDKLARVGAEAIVEVLSAFAAGKLRPVPQPEQGVAYAAKIGKQETRLDWSQPATVLERCVRAFRPAPGAQTRLGEEVLKIWRARVASGRGDPGTVLESRGALVVACGSGALELEELQRTGGRRMSAEDFLRGFAVAPGARLE